MTTELDIEALQGYNNLLREQAANWEGGRGAYPAWSAIEHNDRLIAHIRYLNMRIDAILQDNARLVTQVNLTCIERDLALESITRLQQAFFALQPNAVLEKKREGLPLC